MFQSKISVYRAAAKLLRNESAACEQQFIVSCAQQWDDDDDYLLLWTDLLRKCKQWYEAAQISACFGHTAAVVSPRSLNQTEAQRTRPSAGRVPKKVTKVKQKEALKNSEKQKFKYEWNRLQLFDQNHKIH